MWKFGVKSSDGFIYYFLIGFIIIYLIFGLFIIRGLILNNYILEILEKDRLIRIFTNCKLPLRKNEKPKFVFNYSEDTIFFQPQWSFMMIP